MRRRSLVLGSALALGVTALRAAPKHRDVLVVGAGLAGLACALSLQRAGLSVQVLEARQRVGGRLHTVVREGLRFELGGVEIGSAYARVLAQARTLGLALEADGPGGQRATAATLIQLRDGALLTTQWAEDPRNPLHGEFRALAPGALLASALGRELEKLPSAAAWLDATHAALDVSLWDHLAASGWSSEALRLMDVAANYTGLRGVSALDVLRRERLRRKSAAGTLRLTAGSQALPEAMARALAEPPLLGADVVAVESSRSEVRVHCADGRTFRARRAVLALPCAPLTRIRFDPEPPPPQLEAWRERRYTPITTVHFRALRPFWEADGLPVTTWYEGSIERLFGMAGAGGRIERLIAWINGAQAAALDATGADERLLADWVRVEIERQRPAARDALALLALQSWGRDRFAGGAYAEIAPGRCASTAKWTARPFARMHFAGEHTAFDEPGMEAAMASAERAAAEVLAVL